MKKVILVIISFITITSFGLSQEYQEDIPLSFIYNLQTDIEVYNLNVQISKVQDNPRIEIVEGDTIEIFDPIIGELFNVSINMNKMGTWTEIDDGDSIWQLQINSIDGIYMMLIFDDFYLPKGSKLFVYSTDRSQILGAFTDDYNVSSSKFTTAPLKTNSIIIEYYKPYHVEEPAKLNINYVGLIVDSLSNDLGTRGFGNSGRCMVNVMCPEYDNWCNERRSVALIYRIYTELEEIRTCTGSLITNERRDGKPFFLTAFHCIDYDKSGSISQSEKDAISDWLFIFNYQSPDCSNPASDPGFVFFIMGAEYLKGHDKTDYALLQLDRKPRPNFNAYYNGWSNDKDDMTSRGACIHHPTGDIKKISKWKKANTLKVNFWKVKYTSGSTESGSSGSALFNSSGYIVGQLNGGKADCGNNKADFFGCFHRSWHNFGLSGKLNPNGSHSGGYQYWISSMNGDETCRQNWIFNNCNDLHTSDNVSFLVPQTVGTRQYDGVYNAQNQIFAENSIIQSGTTVVFEAGNSITLNSGFIAEAGSNFIAQIRNCQLGCGNGRNSEDDYEMVILDSEKNEESNPKSVTVENNENIIEFTIYPNPNNGIFTIMALNEKSEFIKMTITDLRGVVVYSTNFFTEEVHLPNPVSGIYFISLYFKDKFFISKFAVL